MITVAFMTLGCKVNYYETKKLSDMFENAGAKVVSFDEPADIYVVNTCTVTNIADRKSRKMLHRAKRINESAFVVALGCYVEANKDTLSEDLMIDMFIGNDEKDNAFSMIMERYLSTCEKTEDSENPADGEGVAGSKEISKNKEADDNEKDHIYDENERTRAYIKIQDGCNQFCSYCKIPYVRGRLKSRDENEIIDEITELAKKGYKEVVVTGIHLSSYGVDKSECKVFTELNGRPLLQLANQIADVDGIERIRFGSLEPRIITEEFISELAKNKKICPHFHLSLQSGCDKTLAAMNRKYSAKEYEDACNIIKKYYDRPALTTDVIVGFPGETAGDFEESRNFVRQIGFSDLHVFKYSPRNGTKAAGMKEQVPESIKNERSRELINAGKMLTKEYNSSFIAETQTCLVEEVVSFDGKEYYIGHNERYIKLIFQADDNINEMINKLVEVVPVGIYDENMLLCERKTP